MFFGSRGISQPGTLDNSFGIAGKVVMEDFGYVYATALQTDGKIVIGGTTPYSAGLLVSRLNSTGSLDFSFGLGGKAYTVFPQQYYDDQVRALAIQTDGKIIATGAIGKDDPNYPQNYNYNILLVRYNTDGTTDTTFGDKGIIIDDFGSEKDYAFDVALQEDGKIVIAGMNFPNFFIARYLPDGKPDLTFGNLGIVKILSGSYANSVVIQPDGKIVAGGVNNLGLGDLFMLARYNSDGVPDSSFGKSGIVKTDFAPGGEIINSVTMQPDGKIVAAGISNGLGSSQVAVARYLSNGNLDSTFNDDGKVSTSINGYYSSGNKVLVTDDNKIVVAGSASDFLTIRYNKDGSLNENFGIGGIVITNFGEPTGGNDAMLQPDGKIVVVGTKGSYSLAVARYNGNEDPGPIITKLKKWLHHHGITWDDKPGNNISYYSVQRSTDGAAFKEIARILHNSNTANYNFEDPAPLNGDNHYRLSAVSTDGSSVNSNIVLVENNNAAIKIYPNPAKNNLVIEGLASTGNTKLRITDLYGNIVLKATATANTHTCNIASLKAGTYIISIETGNEIITRKFIKE